MKKVAVVILNWNGKDFIEKFTPTLLKYTDLENTDIWIADNASQDNSVEYVKQNFPQIKVLILDKNYGFAEGYNLALEKIEAEYFVILNSDVEVSPNWISPIIEYLDNNKEVAVVQPKILAYYDKKKFEYAGAAGGFIDKLGYPFCRGRILDTSENDEGQYNDLKEIFWATGACMFIRSEEFNKNKFDSDFFAHMEEIDLCWRLKNKGRKIIYFPEVTVYHVGGGTLPQNSPYKLFLNYRNNLFLLYKNLPKNKTLSTIFKRMIMDGMSAIVYLLKFEFSYFSAVFRAHMAFYKLLKNFKEKRKILITNNKEQKEVYKKSIIFEYFLRKKVKFTQLNF